MIQRIIPSQSGLELHLRKAIAMKKEGIKKNIKRKKNRTMFIEITDELT